MVVVTGHTEPTGRRLVHGHTWHGCCDWTYRTHRQTPCTRSHVTWLLWLDIQNPPADALYTVTRDMVVVTGHTEPTGRRLVHGHTWHGCCDWTYRTHRQTPCTRSHVTWLLWLDIQNPPADALYTVTRDMVVVTGHTEPTGRRLVHGHTWHGCCDWTYRTHRQTPCTRSHVTWLLWLDIQNPPADALYTVTRDMVVVTGHTEPTGRRLVHGHTWHGCCDWTYRTHRQTPCTRSHVTWLLWLDIQNPPADALYTVTRDMVVVTGHTEPTGRRLVHGHTWHGCCDWTYRTHRQTSCTLSQKNLVSGYMNTFTQTVLGLLHYLPMWELVNGGEGRI